MIYWKKNNEHKMCIFIFSTTFVWNIFHSMKNRSRYDQKMYIGLHVKCPLYKGWNFNSGNYLFTTDTK